jgi:hypothetical protein|nr:MAG TPA: SOAR Orai1-activating region [Caudoviricetes sp.]
MAEKISKINSGTVGSLVPMDEKRPDDLDSSILCSISEDEITLNLPVKYLRSRLSTEEISELLEKSARFIVRQVQ